MLPFNTTTYREYFTNLELAVTTLKYSHTYWWKELVAISFTNWRLLPSLTFNKSKQSGYPGFIYCKQCKSHLNVARISKLCNHMALSKQRWFVHVEGAFRMTFDDQPSARQFMEDHSKPPENKVGWELLPAQIFYDLDQNPKVHGHIWWKK